MYVRSGLDPTRLVQTKHETKKIGVGMIDVGDDVGDDVDGEEGGGLEEEEEEEDEEKKNGEDGDGRWKEDGGC
ncbi:hypothetical protein TWF173_004196 [Orbilia oligospora]|nr:hypothetical protein TWF173_004196 [Orbilia oligospora]